LIDVRSDLSLARDEYTFPLDVGHVQVTDTLAASTSTAIHAAM